MHEFVKRKPHREYSVPESENIDLILLRLWTLNLRWTLVVSVVNNYKLIKIVCSSNVTNDVQIKMLSCTEVTVFRSYCHIVNSFTHDVFKAGNALFVNMFRFCVKYICIVSVIWNRKAIYSFCMFVFISSRC